MIRRAAKVDSSQAEIVQALRDVGASVWITSGVGQGAPDLVVGFRGQSYCLECKRPGGPSFRGRLTPDQERWHSAWRGHVATVCSAGQALRAIGIDA